MNIYQDYKKYIEQQQWFINELEKIDSPIVTIYDDIKAVLDYIAKLAEEHSKIDEDLQEVFDVGFLYLVSIFTDLKTYYDDYFNKSIERLNNYAPLVVYTVTLEDYIGYLRDEELLNDELKQLINNIQQEIDAIMAKNEVFDNKLLEQYDYKLAEKASSNENFNPIASIFSRIREILDLY